MPAVSMDELTREDYLVSAALVVADKFQQWNDSAHAPGEMPEELFHAIDDCIEAWNTGDIPGECRELLPHIETLQREWQEYGMYARQDSPMPRPQFWAVLGAIDNVFNFVPVVAEWEPDYGSVAQLMNGEYDGTKWTDRMVAIEYSVDCVTGPFLKDGIVQRHLVMKEKNHPGSVLGPDFVHPKVKHLQQQAMKYRSSIRIRAERLRERGVQFKGEDESASCATAGTETVEELVELGCMPEQIATIKLWSIDKATKEFNRVKNAISGRPSPSAPDDATDSKVSEIEQLIQLHLEEHPTDTNGVVAKALGCDAKTVAAVRKRMAEG